MLKCLGSFMSNFFKNILAKFEYLAIILTFLKSNKII